MRTLLVTSLLLLLLLLPAISQAQIDTRPVRERFAPPAGYVRLPAADGSFASWLRQIPVRPGCPDIRTFDGRVTSNQRDHVAVLDKDIGSRNLQQCADIVIRLRAEYLQSTNCSDEIHFNFTSGDRASWVDWREGLRPVVNGSDVSWRQSARPDDSPASFRRYLETVFMYAGSMSLSLELQPVDNPARPECGDVYILGGFPGHAMIVIDVAENRNGRRVFMLAQGFMPAQDIHILRSDEDINPWFTAEETGALKVPSSECMNITLDSSDRPVFGTSWPFKHTDLMRFRPTECEETRR